MLIRKLDVLISLCPAWRKGITYWPISRIYHLLRSAFDRPDCEAHLQYLQTPLHSLLCTVRILRWFDKSNTEASRCFLGKRRATFHYAPFPASNHIWRGDEFRLVQFQEIARQDPYTSWPSAYTLNSVYSLCFFLYSWLQWLDELGLVPAVWRGYFCNWHHRCRRVT